MYHRWVWSGIVEGVPVILFTMHGDIVPAILAQAVASRFPRGRHLPKSVDFRQHRPILPFPVILHKSNLRRMK